MRKVREAGRVRSSDGMHVEQLSEIENRITLKWSIRQL